MKTGKKNQKKIIKGIEENEINDFNKTYNDYPKHCGFKNISKILILLVLIENNYLMKQIIYFSINYFFKIYINI